MVVAGQSTHLPLVVEPLTPHVRLGAEQHLTALHAGWFLVFWETGFSNVLFLYFVFVVEILMLPPSQF